MDSLNVFFNLYLSVIWIHIFKSLFRHLIRADYITAYIIAGAFIMQNTLSYPILVGGLRVEKGKQEQEI